MVDFRSSLPSGDVADTGVSGRGRLRAVVTLRALVPVVAALAGLAWASACQPAVPPAAGEVEQTDLPAPARPGSGSPQLAAAEGRLVLSWLEPTADSARVALRYATFDGDAWSAPRTAAEGGDWMVSAVDMPGVTPVAGGTLVAHWLVRGPGSGYQLRVSRSGDDGQTWTPPVAPHRDRTPAEHGFARVVSWAGGAGVVWLDGRAYFPDDGDRAAAPPAPHAHGPAAATSDSAATALRMAVLRPDGRVGDEATLDLRTCDCCQTAAAHTAEGVVVAYRDRSPTEERDISVVRLRNGTWTAPQPVGTDGWRIDGCPVNGPALAAEGRSVALAWFTMAEDRPRVRLAFSTDAGATFGAPIDVAADSTLGRVGVALTGPGTAVVTWMDGPQSGASLRLRRVRATGPAEAPITVAQGLNARITGFPALVRRGDAVVLAWTAADSGDARPRVRTARWASSAAL